MSQQIFYSLHNNIGSFSRKKRRHVFWYNWSMASFIQELIRVEELVIVSGCDMVDYSYETNISNGCLYTWYHVTILVL